MSRKRYQRPEPFREGNTWNIRVYQDVLDENGQLKRIRPRYFLGLAVGPQALTAKQLKAKVDELLNSVNTSVAAPSSIITVEKFIEQKFWPDHVKACKKAGREFYGYTTKRVIETVGQFRLCDITTPVVRQMIAQLEAKGLSQITIGHIKTSLTTIINHAKAERYFSGDNPAQLVKMAERPVTERYAYSFDEAVMVLDALGESRATMVYLSLTTTMNVAEMCGLKWKRLNLTDKTRWSAGEAIPPFSLIVRENYYRNTWGTVKTKKRRRTIGLPDVLVARLLKLQAESKFTASEDPVFASRNGTPLDAHNINNRDFKRASAKLGGIPVTWHIFRHSAATFLDAINMPLADREKMLGHANAAMTMHYTHSDVARRRAAQNEIAQRLLPTRERLVQELMESASEGTKQ